MCLIDDCEPWDVYRARRPRARVEHRCCECRRVVRVGEPYHLAEGLIDGHWHHYRTCQHCMALGDVLRVWCGGYPFTALHEELEAHWYGEGYRSIQLARWVAQLRHGWHEGRDEIPIGCGRHASELMRASMW